MRKNPCSSENPNNCLLVCYSLSSFLHFLSISWNFITVSQVSRLSFLGLTVSTQTPVFHHGAPILPSVAAQGTAEKISYCEGEHKGRRCRDIA